MVGQAARSAPHVVAARAPRLEGRCAVRARPRTSAWHRVRSHATGVQCHLSFALSEHASKRHARQWLRGLLGRRRLDVGRRLDARVARVLLIVLRSQLVDEHGACAACLPPAAFGEGREPKRSTCTDASSSDELSVVLLASGLGGRARGAATTAVAALAPASFA